MRAAVLALALLGAAFAAEAALSVRGSPSVPKDWQANITIGVVPEHGPHFNISAVAYEDSTNARTRLDEKRVIVFEELHRYDLNMTYSIADGHCVAVPSFEPYVEYFSWLADAIVGPACHGGEGRPGVAYLYKSDGEVSTVCLSTDLTTPYWYEVSAGTEAGTKIYFDDFTPGTPAASVFAVPSSCQQARMKL